MEEDPNKKPVVYSFILPLVVGPINTLIVKIVGEINVYIFTSVRQ